MASGIDVLKDEKYVLLTTYRKDGTPVPTPVWAATDGGELMLWSERKAGKVKRIRRDGTVRVQGCDLRGRQTHGPEVTGTARLLDDEGTERVRRLIARKYGLVGRVTMFFSRLRGPKDRTVGIAVRAA
ncbi:PPOX class F420-dependent oxidoreductase [Amycolatopsis acidiphila]|uniref:PPOX class F420-dependent oxidoreductase n=1 Tax=Amycolatopsis acidiphila TaxID=715473 RepID=A0A557ZR73_9PSEU|nr:PPOX class F420-dependent oxidoreductase [Amycolatopsis acidiphila]TVT14510.1 PPOX class F420-dependent oxidoreductase [Amycolatopsis acidiphila]UIJ58409.1 PPOX class F420-dependent oxidoreductase [Amycolatopsis acidiphila]GHG93445.1 PPOX class F420-dependent oxidoreductase [Amycolatopsis acidiphila]